MTEGQNSKPLYDYLQKGLGKAFNYVCQNDSKELRYDLLNACLHDLRYDSQCEESRAEWLFELISLTDDTEFYRQNILDALPKSSDFWDVDQLYNLAAIWAKQGCQEAREIIYKTFKEQKFDESWLGGEQIIAIDGISGLLFVAETVGMRLLEDNELWEDDNLITEAGKSFGDRTVMEALEHESLNNPKVKAYIEAVNHYTANSKPKRNKRRTLDLDTAIEQIEKATASCYPLVRFGRCAADNEIEQLFDRLLQETRKEQLIRYLCIFRQRQFPRIDSYLLELAETSDEELQYAAIAALSENKDDSLRRLALRLIQQPKSVYNRVLKLLINNYHSGDFQIIETVLNMSEDIDFRHYLGMDIIELADTQKTLELKTCSLWVYENTPCSYCRQQIVEISIELQQAPKPLLKECLHDCSSETKALAKRTLSLK